MAKRAKANAKKNESFEEVKEAMGPSITIADQQRILDKIKKQKENEIKGGVQEGNTTPPHRGANDGGHVVLRHREKIGGEMAKRAKANAKKNESFEKVREAMGPSVTIADQQRILDKIKKQKENEIKGGVQEGNTTPPQPRGANNPSRQDSNQPLKKQRSWQEQGHIYEHIPSDSPSAKRRLAEQTKAASADLPQDPHHGQNFGQGLQTQPNQFQGNQQHPGRRQQRHAEHDKLHQGVYQLPPGDQIGPQQMHRIPSHPQLQYHGVAAVTVPPDDDLPPAIALDFEIGSTIQIQSVDPTQPQRYGVIRWIGELPGLRGQVAGIEMEEYMEGLSDGTWSQTGIKYFDCPNGKSIFYPIQHLRQDERFCDPGDVAESCNKPQLHYQSVAAVTVPPDDDLPPAIVLGFEIGSTIQIQSVDPTQPQRYGVIRWIGELPGLMGQVAGIELEEYMDGCTDGTWPQTGMKYFNCPNGKGIFYPIQHLRQDERFCDPGSTPGVADRGNPLHDVPDWEDVDQNLEPHPQQMLKYIGERRGIQGHQNSCYLDATVFGLFALSDVFDSMFLEAQALHKTADQNRKSIKDVLWKGIVNPLRKNGVVRYESVMALRSKLEELGKMEGIAQDENALDPEEFLNMLFKHMLRVEPFIEIRRPFGTEKEFFVQLFLEFDGSMRLPTVSDLLRKMFKEQNISFTAMPSRLLIQLPRFGKQFKTFEKIVPDLKLRIMDLTDTYKNAIIPNCFICGRRAVFKCMDCQQVFNVSESPVNLCDNCDVQVHAHMDRAHHPPRAMFFEGVSELDLLSVICIETSHYVCFAKNPHEEPDQPSSWIFFDSMANRLYDTYNVPRVADCTAELNEWIYPANGDRTRLMSTPPKNLPEYVRRFTQDVYMCVYVHPDLSLYGDVHVYVPNDHKRDEKLEQTRSTPDGAKAPQNQLSQEKNERELLQQQVSSMTKQLQSDSTRLQQEITRLQEQLTQQKTESQQQIEQERAVAAEEKQRMINSHSEAEQQLRYQLGQMRFQLQQQLDNTLRAEGGSVRYTQLKVPSQDQDSWNVPRGEVEIIGEIGRGGWGLVLKGRFRGQTVAVKQAFKEILGQPYTIRLMRREIQIMTSVQHPNLVRFIAAVIDDKVDRGEDTPLLVLEMLDMDLRHAYKTTDLGTNKIPIFRDVAYALHYLHAHQEPIIHRDVSAPNVLLQCLQGGTYRAKLSDFGSANKAKDARTAGPGAICYTAPEAFPPVDIEAPVPPQTPKIDVYSYGILLAEVITRTMPTTENRRQLLLEVKGTWTLMHDLISSCTKPTPSNRPTMASILNTLNRIPTPRPRQVSS